MGVYVHACLRVGCWVKSWICVRPQQMLFSYPHMVTTGAKPQVLQSGVLLSVGVFEEQHIRTFQALVGELR